MKKKYEVLFYIDKLSTQKNQNNPSKMLFSTKELASYLNIQRSNLSAILNELVRENKLEKISGRPVLYKIHNKLDENDLIFNQLIGVNGSLAKPIQDIKSTLLYPGKKPIILLTGESGTGKSLFAKKIYEFCKEKGLVSQSGQLVKLNCKYFMNDETMIKNIFVDYRKSTIDKAKNGMIYFDNVHLIPEKYKSIIYDLIEMSSIKENNFMVVLSSDYFNENDLKSNALDNISIKIDLPSLDKRGLVERLEIVQECFKNEARKIDKSFVVEPETLECLLLYHCKNNIKQLINDISSACSHAFLKNLDNDSNVYVYLDDFPIYVKKGFIFYKEKDIELNKIISHDFLYYYSKDTIEKVKIKESNYTVYEHLEKQGTRKTDTSLLLKNRYEQLISYYRQYIDKEKIDELTIGKYVLQDIIDIVKEFLDNSSQKLKRIFTQDVFLILSLHLTKIINNNQNEYINFDLNQVINKYQKEYILSLKLIENIGKRYKISIPLGEAINVVLILLLNQLKETENKPVLLIAMHGKNVANSLAGVVKQMSNSNSVYSYDLLLEKKMQVAYEEMKSLIEKINRGKGVLLIYDMGSVKTMGKLISKETGIDIRFIAAPSTILALETVKKMSCNDNLDDIMSGLEQSYQHYFPTIVENYYRQKKKNIIITLCMNGEGGAIQIKKYLEDSLELQDIDIFPLSMSNQKELLFKINELKKLYNILCTMGPFDPQLYGVKFISITQLFNTPLDKLTLLISSSDQDIVIKKKIKYSLIFNNIEKQAPNIDIDILKKVLPKFIQELDHQYKLSYDKKIGIIMHLSGVICSLVDNIPIPKKFNYKNIILTHKKTYEYLYDILEIIEEPFHIRFSDSDIASLIMIIKEI